MKARRIEPLPKAEGTQRRWWWAVVVGGGGEGGGEGSPAELETVKAAVSSVVPGSR